ncbi:MAG: molybdopterin molybdenumtransferase MoeA [Hyphomicrobiales bacterium]|nr:MAG: molybdopterin molybdenumtransferase MoeA [Hyphomicrobiales bacterium]
MSLLSIAEAQTRLLADVKAMPVEAVRLEDANGRTLAEDLFALRTQPPFSASAMDGYAARTDDVAEPPVDLKVIGTAAAGHGFDGSVGPGEAVRIFTGAPVPPGADTIVIQENTLREPDSDTVTVTEPARVDQFIRPAGLDFALGQKLLKTGRRLGYRELALAAAMNYGVVRVRHRPVVAILATGDELVPAGGNPGPDQIIASNSHGVAAIVADLGAIPFDLGIASDTIESISAAIRRARDAKADILVTLGGVSVGDHDLVRDALGENDFQMGFWRIAMRPGKPLMFGNSGPMKVLGLPGNPVSSLVCSLLFLAPLIRSMLGVDKPFAHEETAVLGADVKENDLRQDYLRATLDVDANGRTVATPRELQDSSLLAMMAGAEALLIRPPHAPAAEAGSPCKIIRL